MPYSILITSASFLETPGPHLDLLNKSDSLITKYVGPLTEAQLLEIADRLKVDGIVCGTDQFSAQVLERFAPSLKVISRYGVGIDEIDVKAAERLGITVLNTPRLNHASVAELTIGLMIGLARKIPEQLAAVRNGEWRRETGFDLAGKTLVICGFGMVGRQVSRHAMALGMKVCVFNSSWSDAHQESLLSLRSIFADQAIWGDVGIERVEQEDRALAEADFISLHMDLNRQNMHFINRRRLESIKHGSFLINVSRPSLIDESAVLQALDSGRLRGYAADVIESSSLKSRSPFLSHPHVHILPHIGGRTFDGVVKQGMAAVNNLFSVLKVSG